MYSLSLYVALAYHELKVCVDCVDVVDVTDCVTDVYLFS